MRRIHLDPSLTLPQRRQILIAGLESSGWTIRTWRGKRSITIPILKRIYLDSNLTGVQEVAVIAHEAEHARRSDPHPSRWLISYLSGPVLAVLAALLWLLSPWIPVLVPLLVSVAALAIWGPSMRFRIQEERAGEVAELGLYSVHYGLIPEPRAGYLSHPWTYWVILSESEKEAESALISTLTREGLK